MNSRRKKQQKTEALLFLIPVFILGVLLQGWWVAKQEKEKPSYASYVKPEHVELLVCPFCEGDGTLPDMLAPDQTTLCMACQGAGGRLVRVLTPWYEPCHSCGGMGHRLNKSQGRSPCTTCNTWGVVPATNAPPQN